MNLVFFTNDRYHILKILFDNQVFIKGDQYINLSQQEIADIAQFSKLKTNKIIRELIGSGYVHLYMNKRGKYALAEEALRVIKVFESNLEQLERL